MVISKESKSYKTKKEDKKLDLLWKRYMHYANINMLVKQIQDLSFNLIYSNDMAYLTHEAMLSYLLYNLHIWTGIN